VPIIFSFVLYDLLTLNRFLAMIIIKTVLR